MNGNDRKMSDIMLEMLGVVLKDPEAETSTAAAQVGLMTANLAWNESIGAISGRKQLKDLIRSIEAEEPELWRELKFKNSDVLIDVLLDYKKKHFPDDHRRIIVCGIIDDKIRVEWLKPAEPGVDSDREMALYSMIYFGDNKKAIKFVMESEGLSREAATKKVADITAQIRPDHLLIQKKIKASNSKERKKKPVQRSRGMWVLKEKPISKPGSVKRKELFDSPGSPEPEIDPIFFQYVLLQNLIVDLVQEISRKPELKNYRKHFNKAEKDYMPSGPPMSPLTTSYFNAWALNDLRFKKKTTMASIVNYILETTHGMNDQLNIAKTLADSRMGIYEHIGMQGPYIKLRELLTNDEFVCRNISGYQGRKGEFWYVRLLPPIKSASENATYFVTFNTPYILTGTTKEDWYQFFERWIKTNDEVTLRSKLYDFMKFGPSLNFWNEFVFLAFHYSQYDAIFLKGIPDINSTLPHGSLARK